MVLRQHVMLCGNKLLRVQLARCASYATYVGSSIIHILYIGRAKIKKK